MPVKIIHTKRGYTVKTPNMVHGKNMTHENAEKQSRLLRAVEHGWKPGKKK